MTEARRRGPQSFVHRLRRRLVAGRKASGSASREETAVAVAGDSGTRNVGLEASTHELAVALRTDWQLPGLAFVEVVEARERTDRVGVRWSSGQLRLVYRDPGW